MAKNYFKVNKLSINNISTKFNHNYKIRNINIDRNIFNKYNQNNLNINNNNLNSGK